MAADMSMQAPQHVGEVGTAAVEIFAGQAGVHRLWISAQHQRVEIWLQTTDIDADGELELYGRIDPLADRFPEIDLRLHLLHPRRMTLPAEAVIPQSAVEIPRRAA